MPEATRDALTVPFLAALAVRLREPERLPAYATALWQLAGGSACGQGLADVVQGWGHLYAGESQRAEAAARRALQTFMALHDAAGLASARDALATCDLLAGRLDGALAMLAPTLDMASGTRSPLEWSVSYTRLASIQERLGHFDEALRWHYRAVAAARNTGDPAIEAVCLGGLGGLQLSMCNLDDAQALLQAAWHLLGDEGRDWVPTWSVVVLNRLMLLTAQGRFDEAVPLAETTLRAESRMPLASRPRRRLLMAHLFAAAGQFERAQGFLNEGLAPARPGAAPPVEWVWVQARVWNGTQRPADALRICAAHFEAAAAGTLPEMPMPVDLVRLYEEVTLAHEALGDSASALGAQRAMIAAERDLVSVGARARRTTLQIQYELAAAERERDEARRREQDGALEQARLAEVNEALHQANEAKTRFLAAASHDLRQPVAALNMYMAAIKLEGDAARREGLMQRMEESLHALGGLFDALLDISRLDAGLVRVDAAPLRLDRLLERLVGEHRLRAQELGLGLRLRLPPTPQAGSLLRSRGPGGSPRPTACTDAALLERCLRNLVDNALKYTTHGGVVVRLRAAPGVVPAAWRIEVRDTGPGIAPELHQTVFEEFFQIDNAERDRARGLGLGLSIVRRLGVLLGLGLGLASRPGRGCSFHLTLPQHAAHDDAAPVPRAPAAAGPRLALIVIDDDAAVRDSLGALLQRWGHFAFSGDSASTALASWRLAGRPLLDGALVDLRLRGGVSGLDAIVQLRQQTTAALPALVITGDITPPRLALLEAAAQPWLPKPLLPMPLRSWLHSLRRPTPSARGS